jgi:nitroreductase
MVHPVLEMIHERRTVERFDPHRTVDDATIVELVQDATRAPSSFNLQHWRFVAVRRPEDREKLKSIAFGQEQVRSAPVTFIVLADLQAVDLLPEILEVAVERGAMAEGKAAAWIRMAREIYADPVVARDEAVRSASLAAMTLMLAAEARGLATGALTGFDPARLRAAFGIGPRWLPVMLVTVGWAAERSDARMPRLKVEQVLAFDRWR